MRAPPETARRSYAVRAAILLTGLGGCANLESKSKEFTVDRPDSGGADGTSAGGAQASGGSSNPNAGGSGAATASVGGSAGSGGTTGGDTSNAGGPSGGNPGVTECSDSVPSDPAPSSAWANATGNLANMPAGCGTLSRVEGKPCSNALIAGVADQGLFQSNDSGDTWTPLGTGDGSTPITNNPLSILFDPENPDHFWENGLFGGGGLYATTDAGATFTRLGTEAQVQLLSVDFGDPERKTMLFGKHGEKQQVWRSTDGGQNFENIGASFPGDAHNSESPLVIDAQTYLLGACGNGGGAGCGIYRTTDAGASWSSASPLEVSHYGKPLWASDGAIYWPLLATSGLGKSTDLGQSWNQVVEGTVKDVTPVELPDGSLLSVGADHVVRSTDGGVSWAPVGETLPFGISGGNDGGVTYSARRKTMYVWHFDCGSSVASNALMRAGFDYEAQ
jgi:hypothetical protein